MNPIPFICPPTLTSYDGGKGQAGVYQRLINEIPPHKRYIEPFLGGGKILAYKRPAEVTQACDCDIVVIDAWKDANPSQSLAFQSWNALYWIAREYKANIDWDKASTFMYLDPPYMMETRSTQTPLYPHEFGTFEEHHQLLSMITKFRRMRIMISCYDHELYRNMLAGWVRWEFQAVKRNGEMSTETVYQNYPRGGELHDYRYLGSDFRERERITRKVKRWASRLEAMPARERNAVLASLKPADFAPMPETLEAYSLNLEIRHGFKP